MRAGLTTIVFLFTITCYADSDEQLFREAVHDTQKKMNSPEARKSLIKTSEAQKANSNAEMLVGNENIDEIYSLSAQILPTLSKSGDPEEVAKVLEKAQRNPAEFLQSLPPEIQAHIKSFAQKIENKKSNQIIKSSP